MQVQKFETNKPVMVALEATQFCVLYRPRGRSQLDHGERSLETGPGHFRLYPHEIAYIYQNDFNCLTRNGLTFEVYPLACRYSLAVTTQKPDATRLESIPLGLEGNEAQLESDVFDNLRRPFELAVRGSAALASVVGQVSQLAEAQPQYSAQAKTDLLNRRARLRQSIARLNDELHYQASFGAYPLRGGLYRVEFYLESVNLAPNVEAELNRFEQRVSEIEQESRRNYQQNYDNFLQASRECRKYLKIEGLPGEQKVALMKQTNHLLAALTTLVKTEAHNHFAAQTPATGQAIPPNFIPARRAIKVVNGPRIIDATDEPFGNRQ